MEVLEGIYKKYQREISEISANGASLSYTGGSSEKKLSVSLASDCPAKFWLTALGFGPKIIPHFLLEGSLAHGCVEQYHKSQKQGKFASDHVKAWLWSQNGDNALKLKIWRYFRAYLEFPTKHLDKMNNFSIEGVRHKVINSEKNFSIDAINYFSGELMCSKIKFQGRIDLIEDVLAYPVKKIDNRIIFVDYWEVKNAFDRIKTGDAKIMPEGVNFFLSNLLFEKPITKKDQVGISGEREKKAQDKRVVNVANLLMKKKPIRLNGITSDLKTSSGSLDFERHIGQLSYYSYLRGVTEGKMPRVASVINIEKKEKTISVMPKRSRAIFTLNKSDFVEVANKLGRSIDVIKNKITTRNCANCCVPYHKGGYGQCGFYPICHAEKLMQEGIDVHSVITETIKKRRLGNEQEK